MCEHSVPVFNVSQVHFRKLLHQLPGGSVALLLQPLLQKLGGPIGVVMVLYDGLDVVDREAVPQGDVPHDLPTKLPCVGARWCCDDQ